MTLEELKYFTDQFQKIRDELRRDFKELREHIDERLGSQADDIAAHEKRLTALENINWRNTALFTAAVVVVQILINAAAEFFKR